MRPLGTAGLVSVVMAVACALLPTAALADAAQDDELAARVAMVRTLLFESSAARRVEASDFEVDREKRAEAIALWEAAQQPGDTEERKAMLNRAVDLMYQASAGTRQSASSLDKSRRDFDRRRESLDALLDAHKRIMKEKGTSGAHMSLLDSVENDISAADELLDGGDVNAARERLDRAYEATRLAVETSRQGETLKRELKFDTPEDEYLYELDRNETHRMLLTVLLRDKMSDKRIRDKVDAYVETADEFRATADALAREKQFTEAIGALERSTAEIVKAIRGAGVYIPG